MEVNQILLTKDGRVFGNAIVIKKYKSEKQKKLDLYDFKTDYGSVVTGYTARSLRSDFYIPEMKYHFNIEDHKHYIKVEETFKCDGCGKDKPIKEKFEVYNENYKLQKGVYECAECKGI